MAILSVILVLAVSVGLWRLAQGPVDMSFAKDYVEKSLNESDTPYRGEIGGMVLSWQDLREPPRVNLVDLKIFSDDSIVMGINEVGVTLGLRNLLIGQIRPKDVIFDSPTLKLARTEDNDFKLDIEENVKQVALPPPEKDTTQDTEFAVNILKRLAESQDEGPFERLRSIKIEKAKVIVVDHHLGISWIIPQVDFSFEKARRGIEASGILRMPGMEGKTTTIKADSLVNQDFTNIHLEAEIKNADLAAFSDKIFPGQIMQRQLIVFDGDISADFGKDLALQKAEFSIDSPTGQAVIPDLYDEPLLYKDLKLRARYNKTDNILKVERISARIRDILLNLSADLTVEPDHISGSALLEIPETSIAKVRAAMPDRQLDEDVDEWLFQKIKQGDVTSLRAEGQIDVQKDNPEHENPNKHEKTDVWDVRLIEPKVEFNFDNLELEYAFGLMPVTQGRGVFSLYGEEIDVIAEKGNLGSLNISNGVINVTNIFTRNSGAVDIDADVSGPLRGVVDYLEVEEIDEKINYEFQPDKIKGQADFKLNVDFPTRSDVPFEAIIYKIDGTIKDAFWPDAFEKFSLSGGPFSIRVSPEDIELQGQGSLGKAPADIHWHEYFDAEKNDAPFQSKIEAKIKTDDSFRDRLGVDLGEYIKGPLPASLTYISEIGPAASADITIDMTKADIFLEELNYTRFDDGPGTATLKASFFDGAIKQISDLKIKTDEITVESGQLSFIEKNQESVLSAGKLENIKVQENDIASFAFEITPEDILKMKLAGKFFDARSYLQDDKEKADPIIDPPENKITGGDPQDIKPDLSRPKIIAFDFDRVRTDPTGLIENVKLYIKLNENGEMIQFETDARAGDGDLYLRYKPDETGQKNFRLEVGDAGAALQAFDLYDNVRGGELTIFAEPITTAEKGDFKGRLVLKDFKVVNAPVLAKLVSALSLPGLAQLFKNEGVNFTRLKSDFKWNFQEKGAKITLKNGRTSGNSLGLTFEGFINRKTSKVDVTGTIVPISGLNALVSNIPILGDVFAGGKGEGIFAATYAIKGKMSDPSVTVNPLAALAPGFLRGILFQDDEDDTDDPEIENKKGLNTVKPYPKPASSDEN